MEDLMTLSRAAARRFDDVLPETREEAEEFVASIESASTPNI